MFKIIRHSNSLKSFGKTVEKSLKELVVLLVFIFIGVTFFSSILFYCESKTNPKFSSIPATFWWAVITMTTV